MSRNSTRGRVYRRCACRNDTGRQLGARCPKLRSRGHGRWAFAVDLPSLSGRRRTMRRCGYPTQTDARAALRHVLECERASVHLDDRQTVADYLIDWLAGKAVALKPTTLVRYQDYITKDLIPALGAIRLEQLSHQHLACFIRDQLAAGRGPITLRHCVATLSATPRSTRRPTSSPRKFALSGSDDREAPSVNGRRPVLLRLRPKDHRGGWKSDRSARTRARCRVGSRA